MKYQVIVIGGGISGLTAASLLAKRGLQVAVIDSNYNPGGSCGTFKRSDVVFDQGSAMLFGFGEKGFNAHRFVFNCLEEPFEVIKHDLLYCVNFKGHRIKFWPDIDQFAEELSRVFPSERKNIYRFYHDLQRTYEHVMVEDPAYVTPDETDPKNSLKSMKKHPISYARFLSYLNKSAKSLLSQYFKDPEIFKFFDKLTSTYCYSTVRESPAVLASVMFVDNHIGGSYYPAGSTHFLPGKLEKVIEEHGGVMIYEKEVRKIIFNGNRAIGVELNDGSQIIGDDIIYSGTVWNLYENLIPSPQMTPKKLQWANELIPTYPSVVLYAYVDREVIPEDIAPVEMLVGNPDYLDESEVTAYIFSIDDHTLCPSDGHVVMAIGPTFEDWSRGTKLEYNRLKESEKYRLFGVLERRFPGFQKAVRFSELATPKTIERYTLKKGGSVAGPKQMLGQHMFKRLHTKSDWENLYLCGESTVMGTGTPTVTTSGISAANVILRKRNLKPFVYEKDRKDYVTIIEKPFTFEKMYQTVAEDQRNVMRNALQCQFCQNPTCTQELDVRGIMRRVSVGNFIGAKNILDRYTEKHTMDLNSLSIFEDRCIKRLHGSSPVNIMEVVAYIKAKVV